MQNNIFPLFLEWDISIESPFAYRWKVNDQNSEIKYYKHDESKKIKKKWNLTVPSLYFSST
jgi:hypothetical protein